MSAASAPGHKRSSRARLILAAILLVISLPCVAYGFFVGALILPLPPALKIPIVGFAVAAAIVAALYFAAPVGYRVHFAILAAVLSTAVECALASSLREFSALMAVPAIGVAAFTLRLVSHNLPDRYARLRTLSTLLLALFPVFVAASFFDLPALPDATPGELRPVLQDRRLSISRFYSYSLGGFLDWEWLWRIDAEPQTLESIAQTLGMNTTPNAPRHFWSMPPYYWPRRLPNGGSLYASPGFPMSGSRGPDGAHYFMLTDPNRSRAFVWFKNNF